MGRIRRVLGRVLLMGALTAGALGPSAWGAPPAGHKELFSGRWFHAPVADEDCTVCHTIHGPGSGASLQAPVPELCYQCHEDVAAKDVVHEPVGEGGCTDCHRPHTSDQRPLLVAGVPDLCIHCHPADEAHVGRGNICTSCHGVHSSETGRFLKGDRSRNCGRCHADKREGDSLHLPAREGKCLSCHFTHPDPRFATEKLRDAYPAAVITPYVAGGYRLCDGCHDARLHGDPDFRDTAFRTAAENLHLRHLLGEKGVACSACHDIHATRRPSLVVDWVRLPGRNPQLMQFIRFSTGGTCGPSCHGSALYLHDEDAEVAEDKP